MDEKQLIEYNSNKPTLTGINCSTLTTLVTFTNSFPQQPYIANAITMSIL